MHSLDRQEGGTHYKSMDIEPLQFILANNLSFCEGNIVKLVCRHKLKGEAADLLKAIHYLEIMIEAEYPEERI